MAVRDGRAQRFFSATPPVCAAVLVIWAAVVLLGWSRGAAELTALLPGSVPMLPMTAVAFMASGLSLLTWVGRPIPRWRAGTAMGLAGVVILVGVLGIIERVAGRPMALDVVIFPAVRSAPGHPGWLMALNSVIGFICGGMALLLVQVRRAGGGRPSELFAAAVLATGFVAAVGYAYDVASLYRLEGSLAMSLGTALCFVILAVGVLALRPRGGVVSLITGSDASGVFLRRLLPAVVLVPLGLGWLWSMAARMALFRPESGIALFVVASSAVFSVVVLVSASTVRSLDSLREESLRRAEAARAEAETANRAKADFLATMSHELRTPLNAIIGYTDLLDMELRGPLTDVQREDMRRIRRSSQYLLGLINDMLNFARLEAGRVEIASRDVQLHGILAGMEALIAPQLDSRSLRYEYRPCRDAWRVMADPERLEQILVNLLTNACKFTEPGGMISLVCELRAREVLVHVRDTGRGIRPEKLATIFDPFVQVDRELIRESQQGVGLGLAISRDLARAMNGDLTARSTPGEGSTFTIHLRRAPSVEAHSAPT